MTQWIGNARRHKFVVLTRDLSECPGRLGFIARTLHWLKPHLGLRTFVCLVSCDVKRNCRHPSSDGDLDLRILEYISTIVQRERKFTHQCQANIMANGAGVPQGC